MMENRITPFVTNEDMVRPVPDAGKINLDGLPNLSATLIPGGVAGWIRIHGGSPRTRLLIERIYGPLQWCDSGQPAVRAATLLIREGDYPPSFVVDRADMIIQISGPVVSVAQLKISVRYLTARLALDQHTSLVPIHGCLVVLDGASLLVCGSSGTGKSWMSADLVAQGGIRLVDDWALYDSSSGRCMAEDESNVIRRGGDPLPAFPPWMLIEEFNGDPRSPQSRYISLPSRAETVRGDPVGLTHMLILDEPDRANASLCDISNVGDAIYHMQPRFTDEALDILGQDESRVLIERLNVLGATLSVRRLIGYRASADHYQQALSLVNDWIASHSSRRVPIRLR
jgi:hypothetical protein